jgi:hypothetical protein
VISALSAAEPLVRETAALSLSRLDGPVARRHVAALVRDAEPVVARLARALREPGGQEEMMLSTIEKVIALKGASIFAETPGESLVELATQVDEIAVSGGDTIINKGDLGDCMYVIVVGEVRVHDGERTLNHLGEGDVFGEMAVLDAEPRVASVTGVLDDLVGYDTYLGFCHGCLSQFVRATGNGMGDVLQQCIDPIFLPASKLPLRLNRPSDHLVRVLVDLISEDMPGDPLHEPAQFRRQILTQRGRYRDANLGVLPAKLLELPLGKPAGFDISVSVGAGGAGSPSRKMQLLSGKRTGCTYCSKTASCSWLRTSRNDMLNLPHSTARPESRHMG